MTIYRFDINGTTVTPIYGPDLSKDFERESGQMFFRAKLNGELTFIKDDYDLIMGESLGTELVLTMDKSDDNGLTWEDDYFVGYFYLSDCEINVDDESIKVKVNVKDRYTDILAGLDTEYNIVKLACPKTFLAIDKRPLIQLYAPGDSVVSCFLSGNAWDQEVAFEEEDTYNIEHVYHFWSGMSNYSKWNVYGTGLPQACVNDYVAQSGTTLYGRNDEYYIVPSSGTVKYYRITNTSTPQKAAGDIGSIYTDGSSNKWIITDVDLSYIWVMAWNHGNNLATPGTLTWVSGGDDSNNIPYTIYATLSGTYTTYELFRDSDSTPLFTSKPYSSLPGHGDTVTLLPWDDESSGLLYAYIFDEKTYLRVLCDTDTLLGNDTRDIPSEDICANNRNYKKCLPYPVDCVYISNRAQAGYTEYGLADDELYFLPPDDTYKYYPVARSSWGYASLWLKYSELGAETELDGRKTYVMGDSLMLHDVLATLLAEVDVSLTHEDDEDHSEILYSSKLRLMLMQKSNILAGEYEQPAKKAPITLGQVFTMLSETMRLYWFIDDDSRLVIEHVSWFKNGGAYTGSPTVEYDLTTLCDPKNKKPWSFGTNKYNYDKIDIPERYEFSWMDDVTDAFDGFPIIMNSPFVQKGKKESVTPGNFTSDVDYMLLNPSAISQDGFALMKAFYCPPNLISDGYINVTSETTDYNFWDNGVFNIELKTGVTYTLSVKGNKVSGTGSLRVFLFNSGWTWRTWLEISETDLTVNSRAFIPSSDQIVMCRAYNHPSGGGGQVYIEWAMLQEGSVYIDQNTQFIPDGALVSPVWKIAYYNVEVDNAELILQNGLLSWLKLHPEYWMDDLPCYDVNVNGADVTADGIQRKKKQTVLVPLDDDPDTFKLIKTGLGNGQIEKVSLNLESRMAEITLVYDTE